MQSRWIFAQTVTFITCAICNVYIVNCIGAGSLSRSTDSLYVGVWRLRMFIVNATNILELKEGMVNCLHMFVHTIKSGC